MNGLPRTVRRIREKNGARPMIGRLGRQDGALQDDAGRYYVREIFAGGERPAVALPIARDAAFRPGYNLTVRLGRDTTGQKVILGEDQTALPAQGLRPVNPLNPGDITIYKEQLKPLRSYPSPNAGEPLTAVVAPGYFMWNGLPYWFTGSKTDLAGTVPSSGNWCYTVHAWRASSNDLVIGSSTPQSTSSALDVTDAREAVADIGYRDIVVVRLYRMTGDMTQLDGNISHSPDVRGLFDGSARFYQIIEDSGTPVAQRGQLNLIAGDGVTLDIEDNEGDDSTDVTISSSGGTPNFIDVIRTVISDAPTTSQEDYAPTGFATASVLLIEPTGADINIGGFAARANAQILIVNTSATHTITLLDNSSGSSSGNKIRTPSFASVRIFPKSAVFIGYNDTDSVWYVVDRIPDMDSVDGILNINNGGTGLTSYAHGDLLVGDTFGALGALSAAGAVGKFLKVITTNVLDWASIEFSDITGTLLHSALGSIGADDHHNKSHAHNGSDGSGTVTHSATTGQTTDDHHAKSHVHNADGSGSVAHTSLTTVGANDHHAKSHAHSGADGSGTVAHSATTGIGADDHHAKSHTHNADGSGSVAGGSLTGASAKTILAQLAAGGVEWATVSQLWSIIADGLDTDIKPTTDNARGLGTTALKFLAGFFYKLILGEGSAPSAPGSGDLTVWADTADQLWSIAHSGQLRQLIGGKKDLTVKASNTTAVQTAVTATLKASVLSTNGWVRTEAIFLFFNNSGAGRALTVTFNFGSYSKAITFGAQTASATNEQWYQVIVYTFNDAVTGTQFHMYRIERGGQVDTGVAGTLSNNGQWETSSVDTTADITVSVTGTMPTNTSSQILRGVGLITGP